MRLHSSQHLLKTPEYILLEKKTSPVLKTATVNNANRFKRQQNLFVFVSVYFVVMSMIMLLLIKL